MLLIFLYLFIYDFLVYLNDLNIGFKVKIGVIFMCICLDKVECLFDEVKWMNEREVLMSVDIFGFFNLVV